MFGHRTTIATSAVLQRCCGQEYDGGVEIVAVIMGGPMDGSEIVLDRGGEIYLPVFPVNRTWQFPIDEDEPKLHMTYVTMRPEFTDGKWRLFWPKDVT